MKPSSLWILISLLFGFSLTSSPALAQQSLPLDPSAVFKTHVPNLATINTSPRASSQISALVQATRRATFSGTRYIVGPEVFASSTVPEAEEYIAIDPLNPSLLVSAISDFSLRGGYNTTKYSFSAAKGSPGSWSQHFVPRNAAGLPVTADGHSWQANSDPVVAIDRLGNVYLSSLYLTSATNANNFGPNGFYVAVANVTTGVKFSASSVHAVKTNPSQSTTSLEDKPWITVDNSSNASTTGHVYAVWTHFSGNNSTATDMIYFSRSTTQGKTWSSPLRINPASQNGAVQGAQVAVGPGGEVYIAYEVFYSGGQRRQFLTKSINGGSSFSAPVAITPFFNDLSFASTYRTNSFCSLAVNPVSGHVYVVYSDQPSSSAQVEFISSTTAGGLLFSAPQVINDQATGQHFFPSIATDNLGNIHSSWFDTRNSATGSSHYDVYATRSVNNGASFAPNARVSPAIISAGSAAFIGDYAGIAAAHGIAHPVWTTGGFNNGRLATATLQ